MIAAHVVFLVAVHPCVAAVIVSTVACAVRSADNIPFQETSHAEAGPNFFVWATNPRTTRFADSNEAKEKVP